MNWFEGEAWGGMSPGGVLVMYGVVVCFCIAVLLPILRYEWKKGKGWKKVVVAISVGLFWPLLSLALLVLLGTGMGKKGRLMLLSLVVVWGAFILFGLSFYHPQYAGVIVAGGVLLLFVAFYLFSAAEGPYGAEYEKDE